MTSALRYTQVGLTQSTLAVVGRGWGLYVEDYRCWNVDEYQWSSCGVDRSVCDVRWFKSVC
jgi:hypothetical protein